MAMAMAMLMVMMVVVVVVVGVVLSRCWLLGQWLVRRRVESWAQPDARLEIAKAWKVRLTKCVDNFFISKP